MDSEVKRLLEQHYKAWSSGDVEGVVACYGEGCVFEDLAMQATFDGLPGVRFFAEAVAAAIPDFRWEPKFYWQDGERAGCEWHMTGTQTGDLPGLPGTGKSFSVPGSTHVTLKDGKIVHNRDYWSLATYLQQVGLMPTP